MSAAPTLSPNARLRGAVALLALGLAASDAGDAALLYDKLKRSLRDAARRDPLDALAATVLGCSYLFYLAERAENPRCARFTDALVFISSSLSIGNDGAFACTDAGKTIASFVMTLGPSLSASALAGPTRAPDPALEMQRAMLERLDEIVLALRQSP